MRPYLADSDFTLYNADVTEALASLPDGSVDCCVTSPPYWGLRDYGVPGQLGLEPTSEGYVVRMVTVFRAVRRVLADHGTLWLNIGDSYAGSRGAQSRGNTTGEPSSKLEGASPLSARQIENHPHFGSLTGTRGLGNGVKPKDLVGIPWLLAFALRADGWYLRADIIWSKPNPMPESVTDRPTKAHEYVFLLSKRPRYFFDQEAVREPAEWARWGDQTNRKHEGSGSAAGWITSKSKAELQRPQARRAMELFKQAGLTEEHARAIRAVGITDTGKATVTQNGTGRSATRLIALAAEAKEALGGYYREFLVPNGRNTRSVWEIATQPYPNAHFATYPEELVRRCVLAGCPEWVCAECGKPRERLTSIDYENPGNRSSNGARRPEEHRSSGVRTMARGRRLEKRVSTDGWTDCGHGGYRPGIVLDPFLGSGTTALVARKHGRACIGFELSEDYCVLAARRLAQQPLRAEDPAAPVAEVVPLEQAHDGQLRLAPTGVLQEPLAPELDYYRDGRKGA